MPSTQPKTNPYKIGDRVLHGTLGDGTVLSVNGQSVVVAFDTGNHGNIRVDFLAPSDKPDPAIGKGERLERLKRLKERYGGEIHNANTIVGATLYRATVDGEQVTIGIGDDGEAYTFTLKGGRKPLREPEPLLVVNPADWHGKPVPARQWYVPDLIPMRQVTLLSGDGGVGKSLLALQIAAAGAMSLDTLEMEPWAGKTLYVGAEDEADEFWRRLADIARAHGKELDFLFMFRLLPLADRDALLSVPDRSGNMTPTPLWRDIEEFAHGWRPKMIVLDTSADLFGGDEIRRSQVRQFVAMLRKLAIEVDCAVILLAHPSVQGMQSGSGLSGSTGWGNSVRSRLYMTSDRDDPDRRILTNKKNNYGKTGGELRLRWQAGAFVLDDGRPSEAAGLMAKRARELFLRLLSETNRVGSKVGPSPSATYAPKVFADRKDAGGIKKDAFTDAMNDLLQDGTIAIITEGRKGRETKRLVVVADEVAQGRSAGLPDHVSDPPVRPMSDPCQTLSDGRGGPPPITPSASDAASDTSDDGHASLTASNDNVAPDDDDFDPASLTFLAGGAA